MVEAIVVMVRQLQLHVRDTTHYYQNCHYTFWLSVGVANMEKQIFSFGSNNVHFVTYLCIFVC